MNGEELVLKYAEGGELKMPVDDAIELLDRVAERIYVDRWADELSPILKRNIGHGTVGISEKDFLSLKPVTGNIFVGYSGPCVVKDDAVLRRQKDTIDKINLELGGIIEGNVHGGTMWGFIKDVHYAAIDTKKLSIGVMPWSGLRDLETVADDLPSDFPKMHYLAIAGEDYGDHASLFGSLPDTLLLLGGRKGAYLEARAAQNQGNFVVCHDVEGTSEAIATLEGGRVVLPTSDSVISFLKNNIMPDQRAFHGMTCDFDKFNEYLISSGIVNMGFVSTSGAFTNHPYVRDVLGSLLRASTPTEIANKIEYSSGGTRFGGVLDMYDVAKGLGIKTNGIMSGMGLKEPWCDVRKMIYVGDEWGDESQKFIYVSDILVAFSGGAQAKEEIKMAAENGGRYSWNQGVPVIALYDEITKGATWELYHEEYAHENIHYFHTRDLTEASAFLKNCILDSYRQKN